MFRAALCHVVAIFCSIACLTMLPTLGYALVVATSIATSGDVGGPANLVLVPLASFVGAVAFTAFSFVATLVFLRLRKRYGLPAWLPVLLSLVLGFGVSLVLGLARGHPQPVRVGVVGAVLVAIAFNAYWVPYSVANTLLGRLGAKAADK